METPARVLIATGCTFLVLIAFSSITIYRAYALYMYFLSVTLLMLTFYGSLVRYTCQTRSRVSKYIPGISGVVMLTFLLLGFDILHAVAIGLQTSVLLSITLLWAFKERGRSFSPAAHMFTYSDGIRQPRRI
jgi:hypothetical protein